MTLQKTQDTQGLYQYNLLSGREEIDQLQELPKAHIKSLRFENFKIFKDCEFVFDDKKFICFIGTNGTGKSTSLNIIQLLFQRFEGYDLERLKANLGKSVRNDGANLYSGIYTNNDFLITAKMVIDNKDITIRLNKSGFIDNYPEEIKEFLYRLCFTTNFDKAFDKFQLSRNKWQDFKTIFEAITGYEIEEQKENEFGLSGDEIHKKVSEQYVLGFLVKKPHEIISHKHCSDGEKKVIKSLSTLLNMPLTPRIICIDNIEMHVEIQRHLPLINALKKCFPESQIFSTTHSPRVIKTLIKSGEIYDLRLINANESIRNNPGILYLLDEIDSIISTISSSEDEEWKKEKTERAMDLKKSFLESRDFTTGCDNMKIFSKEINDHFINDMAALKNHQNIIAR